MHAEYLARLPPDIRALVGEIERESGTEIAVTPDSTRTDKLGCNIECNGSEILIPQNDYFPPAAVLHELLHIKRMYLDRVPRIVFCEDCNEYLDDPAQEVQLRSGLVKLDNNLEHLVIVPKEIELMPDRSLYWEQRMRRTLTKLTADNLSKDNQCGSVVEHWPFVHHVLPDSNLKVQIRELAEKLQVVDKATAFGEAIIKALDSKEAVVRVWMEHFTAYEKIVCLKYFDIQNRTSHRLHVPPANA